MLWCLSEVQGKGVVALPVLLGVLKGNGTMKTNFRMSEAPVGVLQGIAEKDPAALLEFLEGTLFDVAAVKCLLLIGHQAAYEELERRGLIEDETDSDPEESQEVETDVAADPFDLSSLLGGVVDVSMETPAEQEWFDLSRAGGHELRKGIDQLRDDDNHEWQNVDGLDYVTVAQARIYGYTQFRCPMENAPAYVLMDPEYPQGVERASFEEPVAVQEWFDLSSMDDHVLRTCDQFYGTTSKEWVQVGTVAGQTVSAMKAVGYSEVRCRIEDAPQAAAPPIPATLEPVVDARDPDNPSDWF